MEHKSTLFIQEQRVWNRPRGSVRLVTGQQMTPDTDTLAKIMKVQSLNDLQLTRQACVMVPEYFQPT